MAKRCIVLLALLLCTAQAQDEDPCQDGNTCESCVQIKPRGSGVGTCMWEVTSSGQLCVQTYTPSQEISNVAFSQAGCATIPTTTTTPSPRPTIPTCSEQTYCEACVDTPLQSKDGNLKCVWEVTSSGQVCVSEYNPSQEISNVAFTRQGCATIPSTTTTPPPPPERNPCLDENTCESCVRTETTQVLENLSTCLWVATPSDGYCASTFIPSKEIDKVAFTLNGCKTSPPPPTCEEQETCEACVSTRLQGDMNETCVWEVRTTGQMCTSNYTRTQEITEVIFSQTSCPAIQTAKEIISTTLVIPEPKCECRDSPATSVPSAELDNINEIDVDDHEFGSARGGMRRKHPRRQGQKKNHFEDFAKNFAARKINRMQKRQRKLVSDPCLVGRDCESCVRTPNGDDGHRYCVWEVTNSGSLCVARFIPSQEILKVFLNEEMCKELRN